MIVEPNPMIPHDLDLSCNALLFSGSFLVGRPAMEILPQTHSHNRSPHVSAPGIRRFDYPLRDIVYTYPCLSRARALSLCVCVCVCTLLVNVSQAGDNPVAHGFPEPKPCPVSVEFRQRTIHGHQLPTHI